MQWKVHSDASRKGERERRAKRSFLPRKKEFSKSEESKLGHCHRVILPPALLASLKILRSVIEAKNVLDLELFTQRRSCSKVTKLWLEDVAWRPPPSNWRHGSPGCCCNTELSSFLIWATGEGFQGTCQYRSVEWLDLFCISISCKEASFTKLRLFSLKQLAILHLLDWPVVEHP